MSNEEAFVYGEGNRPVDLSRLLVQPIEGRPGHFVFNFYYFPLPDQSNVVPIAPDADGFAFHTLGASQSKLVEILSNPLVARRLVEMGHGEDVVKILFTSAEGQAGYVKAIDQILPCIESHLPQAIYRLIRQQAFDSTSGIKPDIDGVDTGKRWIARAVDSSPQALDLAVKTLLQFDGFIPLPVFLRWNGGWEQEQKRAASTASQAGEPSRESVGPTQPPRDPEGQNP